MNADADKRVEDEAATARQEQKTETDAQLVELGKVSDTSGGWFGSKLDSGTGFITY
ncbi:MAG TPA: hypothetical protein VHE11_13420 [Steroidobacteraceae bacterium]|nr:hypothetical protein [Steroidobacteraceae bacterium]